MSKKLLFTLMAIFGIAGLLLSACGPAATEVPAATQAPAVTEPAVILTQPAMTIAPTPTPDPIQELLAKVDISKHWNDLSGKISPDYLSKLENLSKGSVKIYGVFVADTTECNIACIIRGLAEKYGYNNTTTESVVVMAFLVDSQGKLSSDFCFWSPNSASLKYGRLEGTLDAASGEDLEERLVSWLTLLNEEIINIDLPEGVAIPTATDLYISFQTLNAQPTGNLLKTVSLPGSESLHLHIYAMTRTGNLTDTINLVWIRGDQASFTKKLFPENTYNIEGVIVKVKAIFYGDKVDVEITAQ